MAAAATARSPPATRRGARDRRRELDDLRPPQARSATTSSSTAAGGRSGCAWSRRSRDSIFQGELLMSDANFLRGCSRSRRATGFCSSRRRAERGAAIAAAIEQTAGRPRRGRDVDRRAARRSFTRVENTYLSTFQTLGGLGLLVGTIGLAAVAAAQRARARAASWRCSARPAIGAATSSRSSSPRTTLLLGWGLAVGALCALRRDRAGRAERGGRLPATAGGGAAADCGRSRPDCYRQSWRRAAALRAPLSTRSVRVSTASRASAART